MRDGIKTRLRELDWEELEELVARLWERRGYETKQTPGTNDDGYDVIARRDHPYRRKIYIQVKSGTSTLSSPKVREYAALLNHSDVDEVIIITTTDFSGPAIEEARTYNVKLIGCDQFARLIEENNAFDLIGLSLIDEDPDPTESTPADELLPPTRQTKLPAPDATEPDMRSLHELDVDHDAVEERLEGFSALRDTLQSTYGQLHEAMVQSDMDEAYQSWVGLQDESRGEVIQQFSTGAHTLHELTPSQRARLDDLTENAALTVIDDGDKYCIVSVTGNRGMTGWSPRRESAASMILLTAIADRSPDTVEVTHTGPPVWS